MTVLSIEQVLAEEAAQLSGEGPSAELRRLASSQEEQERRAFKDSDQRDGADEAPEAVKRHEQFYALLGKLDRAALCCSGGGIRSATFCLGVIQALAAHRLDRNRPSTKEDPGTAEQSMLGRFHFLSTVSGGGYIGSWLSAWRHRDGFEKIWRGLWSRPEGADIEPPELSWLRAYSNYLTPKTGIGSADFWAGMAILLRNLLLNWLVILPVFASALLLLKLAVTGAILLARKDAPELAGWAVVLVGALSTILVSAFATSHRPTRRVMPDGAPSSWLGNVGQRRFLSGDLLPSIIAAICFTSSLTSHAGGAWLAGLGQSLSFLLFAVFGALLYGAGWVAGRPLNQGGGDFWRWALSGALFGILVGAGAVAYRVMLEGPSFALETPGLRRILLPVVFGVPWVLTAQMLAESLFVGLVSYQPNSDADREWLGRAAGWRLAITALWVAVTLIAFAAADILIIDDQPIFHRLLTSLGGLAGPIGALIGRGAGQPGAANKGNGGALWQKIALAVAGPVFTAALLVAMSAAIDLLLLGDSLIDVLDGDLIAAPSLLATLIIALGVTLLIAAIASRCININRFSLHALYRNRLVRAYLGASRQHRDPDRFTGFDDADNLALHQIWPPAPGPGGVPLRRLFHVVNITLNYVEARRLAWQQRKGEAFTASPLHCGSAFKGYRLSRDYAGPGKPYGISLGTAMAISGAAVSPNMGYHTSVSTAMLMVLFNMRLGWWLGNPGPEGEKTYRFEGPATAIQPLVEEALGLTTDSAAYVYLSDGGHFENLGLYEMIRRRCRFILAIDAGNDPDFTFGDLGNTLRKIAIDQGITISFDGLNKMKNRPETPQDCPYHAWGRIPYAAVDGLGAQDGLILYLKPAFHGTEGAGIRAYAADNPTFPHESTADQWFSESQFESYRALGFHAAQQALASGDLQMEAFFAGLAAEAEKNP